MPTARIPLAKVRIKVPTGLPPEEEYRAAEEEFVRRYAEALTLRGFRFRDVPVNSTRTRKEADPPLHIERTDSELIVTQSPERPVGDKDPALLGYLNQIARGDKSAIDQLHAYLVAENDDRAPVLGSLEFVMPGGLGRYSANEDWGSHNDSPTAGREVDPQLVADRKLCLMVLTLFGVNPGDQL